jgi:flagellar hook-associated protein FlgK
MKSAIISLLTMLVLFAQASFAETVYKGTDANGNTIYSDQPIEHGEKIEITVPPGYKLPPVNQNSNQDNNATTTSQDKIIDYKVSIIEPNDQQTFSNDITSIDVKLSIIPKLQESDQVHLIINGQPGVASNTSTFTLNQLPRGSYSIIAEIFSIKDPTKIRGKSQSVTIYQQRAIAKRDVTNLAPQAKQAPQAP